MTEWTTAGKNYSGEVELLLLGVNTNHADGCRFFFICSYQCKRGFKLMFIDGVCLNNRMEFLQAASEPPGRLKVIMCLPAINCHF